MLGGDADVCLRQGLGPCAITKRHCCAAERPAALSLQGPPCAQLQGPQEAAGAASKVPQSSLGLMGSQCLPWVLLPPLSALVLALTTVPGLRT